MDPTGNLTEQLMLARRFDAGSLSTHDANRLSELVLALHDWIRGGGFLPQQWHGAGTPTRLEDDDA